ncbi:TIR domain-containing protein [Streptomyces sp. SS1-1]|uniref:TIR-like protein FxsC n=1 Tax=Streptomyces sp. SS1-1 TaxID=2651869 RepID=UPI001250B988|nr:TIR-like protein FxsC [Streptomyces sp. SS1-1]KAB2973186.1 TIR domain-containing protein [Streptomyces sp. SS1-1]
MPGDVLREELAGLLDTPGVPDGGDVLDVLWIARLSGLDPVDWSLLGDGADPTAPAPPAEPRPPAAPNEPPAAPPGPDPPTAHLHLSAGGPHPAGVRSGGAHAVRVTQPKALTDALALTRALRPLRQRVPSTRTRTLDVAATAAASGDTGLFLPVLRPADERRFSVDLLIDTGATMTVWRRLANELRTLLARHGAFADVRAWALNTDEAQPTLAPFRLGARPASPTRNWKQSLADSVGRRVVLVLTDGVGPAWYGADLPETLATWSTRRPVAALHVLPSRLWHRTGLRAVPVRARGTDTRRATIDVRSSGPLPGIARGRAGAADRARILWLPALEVAGDWLGPWARLVSGRTADPVPLQAVPLTVVQRPGPVGPEDEPDTSAAWIDRFEQGYSPEAFALLRLLAAAPLSLPVMRLVQRTMLPSSTPMHLAEIFLSGLLVRRTAAGPGEDPDSVLYDFRDGVREALLDRLTRTESMHVLEQVVDGVSERVAATFGGVTDFGALVAAAERAGGPEGLELPEGSRAFAEVAMAVIGGVGGDYAQVAAHLMRGRTQASEDRRDVREGSRRRGRRRRGFTWLGGKGDRQQMGLAKPLRFAVGGDGHGGQQRVPRRLPELPPHYIVRTEATDVVRALVRDGSPGRPTRETCVIEGAAGVGKTTLAAYCATGLSSQFTLVRWVRAHNRETLLEELTALADDLGVPRGEEDRHSFPTVRLSALRDHLARHPGWLLIYDGVTSETFRTAPGDPPDGQTLCLSPEGRGNVLVTCAVGTRWPGTAHRRLELEEPDRETAVNFLASKVSAGRVRSGVRDELAILVDLVGTSPATLAQTASTLAERGKAVRQLVIEILLEGTRVHRLLEALVWITTGSKVVGTGVAVRPDVVITSGIDPSSGPFRVHRDGGRSLAVRRVATHSAGPGFVMLVVSEAALPTVELSGPGERAVGRLWYHRNSSQKPTLMGDLAISRLRTAVPGTALFDPDGRLHSVVVSRGDDALPVSLELIRWLEGTLTSQGAARVRDSAPRPGPLFYLSYARRPGSHPGESGQEYRFFTDLTKRLAAVADIPTEDLGFFDPPAHPSIEGHTLMKSALASARVFVALLSPQYFASTWCGMEWDAFSRRELRQRSTPGHGRSAIVPVLWTPTSTKALPAPAMNPTHAVKSRDVTDRAQGILALMEHGNPEAYERAVHDIARTILNTARRTRLDPCDPALFDDLRNAFAPEQD